LQILQRRASRDAEESAIRLGFLAAIYARHEAVKHMTTENLLEVLPSSAFMAFTPSWRS
jgi:hypothetical protein